MPPFHALLTWRRKLDIQLWCAVAWAKAPTAEGGLGLRTDEDVLVRAGGQGSLAEHRPVKHLAACWQHIISRSSGRRHLNPQRLCLVSTALPQRPCLLGTGPSQRQLCPSVQLLIRALCLVKSDFARFAQAGEAWAVWPSTDVVAQHGRMPLCRIAADAGCMTWALDPAY